MKTKTVSVDRLEKAVAAMDENSKHTRNFTIRLIVRCVVEGILGTYLVFNEMLFDIHKALGYLKLDLVHGCWRLGVAILILSGASYLLRDAVKVGKRIYFSSHLS